MAFDLNATVGPIVDGVSALMPSITGLIVAIVPAVITIAVVGFLTGFFDGVLGKLRL